MKKILAFVLAMVMVMALAACGGETNNGAVVPAGTTAAAPAGTTAAAGETTAPAAETEATVAQTEPAVTEPAVTEPAETEPAATEAVADEYIVKTGAPALGVANGNVYTNASLGLTCTMPEGMNFVDDTTLATLNDLVDVNDILAEDMFFLAALEDTSVLVAAFKLGTESVGGADNVEDALIYILDDDTATLTEAGATVDAEPTIAYFTAGQARAALLTATAGGESALYLYCGYQVGDYLTLVAVIAPDMDTAEEILAGIDVE